LKNIDKIIIGLFLLFAATLTNSIFLTEVGYFGALALLLYKWAKTKKNPFQKTGLEIPLLLFILAEILAGIFSVNSMQSFQLALKRFLLIPILYVTLAVAKDEKRIKLIIKVFLGVGLLMAFVYLIASVEHYVRHLYTLEARGPSIFQYVMTAGGLLSIIMVYYFTFFINEKLSLIKKVLLGVGLIIIFLSLAGSYTRAPWLGAASGVTTVLILRRNWLLLLSGFILLLLYLTLNPKISKVSEFEITPDSLHHIRDFSTNGRATDLYLKNDTLMIADYENGLILLKDNKVVGKISTPSPIVSIKKWKNNIYYSATTNRTIVFYEFYKGRKAKISEEYIPKFKLKKGMALGDYFYAFGSEGEVQILTLQDSLSKLDSMNLGIELTEVALSKNFAACFSAPERKIFMYNLVNDSLKNIFAEIPLETEEAKAMANDSALILLTGGDTYVFKIKNDSVVRYAVASELSGVSYVDFAPFGLWGMTFDKKFVALKFAGKALNAVHSFNLPQPYNGFVVRHNLLYAFYSYKNRIASLFDPYHSTNVQRINQWRTAIRIFKDKPLFGVGDIDMHNVYLKYRAPYETQTYGHLHNIYFHVLAALGGFGFIVFIFLIGKVFIMNLKIYSRLKDIPFVASFALGTAGAFTSFLASGLGEWNFGDQEIITLIWFIIGLNISLYKIFYKAGGKENQSIVNNNS